MVGIGLIIGGIFLGTWWFSVIILPLAYGIPKSLLWAARGKVQWRVLPLHFVSPLIWTMVFLSASGLLIQFFPAIATYLRESSDFAFGQLAGIIILIARALFSRSARTDLASDHIDFVKPYLLARGTIDEVRTKQPSSPAS